MFSTSSLFSSPFPIFNKVPVRQVIKLKPIAEHDVETRKGKTDRALKHLLRLNHVNHAVFFHNLQFHNHAPHILASAYLFQAGPDHLEKIYEAESKELDKWTPSPGEISQHDWREYLGDPRYQRAFLDFFEDELVHKGYDWRNVLNMYLFEGDEPLINGLIAGVGHPLIHLGYAYELSSRDIAMEALTLGATSYNFLHKYVDDVSYSTPSSSTSTSLLQVLEKVSLDKRFDGIVDHQITDTSDLFRDHEGLILEYWNSWELPNPTEQFKESQTVASLLLSGTQNGNNQAYDFFLVHVLTTSHAVRVILPLVPAPHQIPLVRQWWLLTLATYITQKRPKISEDDVANYDTGGKGWDWVRTQAVNGKWTTDAHFVKALRALDQASITWGDEKDMYLKSAVKFGEQFNGWSGFGTAGDAQF